ncbi:hypothetical protein [Deinococcus marmoris]|uniref:Uncharacterized protein n=1 Tax=Deinococcus marmoris TaxID=249408 RepID=A0A1U7P529_9DEIO|nr:hypothetical protein [Deinococcus marmoris]OLV20258.1 hypothetical protein BOO71_0000238 [Deinococcus marmoris]
MNDKQRTEDTRRLTLGLRHNFTQIQYSWEYPKRAYEHVSVPAQLVMTLLTFVALTPLEEILDFLAEDSLMPRIKQELDIPDLKLDHPDGLAANLAQWRAAIGSGCVEMVMTPDSRRLLAGLRAWIPATADGTAWEMTLDIERLAGIVRGLVGAAFYWGLPLSPSDGL